jgi:uncharacterized protein YjbI with pentapeptide repeats
MLIETWSFSASEPPQFGDDHVFRYCRFERLGADVIHEVDGSYIQCTFADVDFYGTLFNAALLVDCLFERCTFSGVTFASCRLLACSFDNCTFQPNNLGGECSFDESLWYGCTQSNTIGLNLAAVRPSV